MSFGRTGITFALLFSSLVAHAWSGTGHMVIAAVAERDLSANTRSEVARLLGVGPAHLGPELWQSATWADENRSAESAPWHYINFHFRTDGKRTTNQPEKENVVAAIERFRIVLSDRGRSDADRKLALLYLIHFVGDVHQPLHAVARDTDRHPEGDRGGNEFPITSPTGFYSLERSARNLHSLWDAGAGLFNNEPTPLNEISRRRVRTQADTLRAALPRRTFRNLRNQNTLDWAKESVDVAKKVVYNLPENSEPTPTYLVAAQTLVAQRATLAGYRLADLLNKALGG